ncbi:hypothetical protein CN533_17965 [Priestia megaterium]|uniref:O-antigen ligase family protein n=1 Tax=Priestia megaterium TaxID=1404 RepID=UPI000BF60F8C|nr:O-antigen ligase family protein [Priestia megaterium]PET70547.1 hypothetical protein CN533_17965 [Priestia megaterium]PFK85979.1 hypothetical protein COJ19_18370 [Priestia megaterium]
MLKVFLLMIFCSAYLILFIFKRDKINSSLIFIFFAIVVNLNFKVFDVDGKFIYINLTTIIICITLMAFLGLKPFDKKKKLTIEEKIYPRSFFILIILMSLITFITFVQIFIKNIYDWNLYIYHLTMYITFCLFIIFLHFTSRYKLRKMNNVIIFKLIMVVAFLNFSVSILQYIFNVSFLPSNPTANINYYEGVQVVKRVWGIVGASNGAGNLGAILFPILLYYLYKKKSKLALVIFLFNIIFILLTLTRIAYLAVIIEFIIFYFHIVFRNITYRNLTIRMFTLILSIVVIFVIGYLFSNDIYEILFLDRGNTQDYRFYQYEVLFKLVKDYPLTGIGAGQYVYYVFDHYRVNDIAIHSQFFNMYIETGIFSLLLFLFFNGYILIQLSKKFKTDKWFPISLFTGYLITSNFNPNQYYNVSMYIFMFTILALLFYKNDFEKY